MGASRAHGVPGSTMAQRFTDDAPRSALEAAAWPPA